MSPPGTRQHGAVCVVLHDVAPARWSACLRVLSALRGCADRAGVTLPLTLLVVPRMHGDAALPGPYLRWLHRMAGAGHELALHGLTHRDEGPAPHSVGDWLLRRHYTASEGEFAALPRPQALQRLIEGRDWAQAHGLPMQGFVAPAWLLGPAGLDAAVDAGFRHTCTLDRVIALPQRRMLQAPSLVFSTRSGWRRGLSLAWNRLLARRSREAPLLRLELHPGDGDHAAIQRCWTGLLVEALQHRTPLRLAEAAQLALRTSA